MKRLVRDGDRDIERERKRAMREATKAAIERLKAIHRSAKEEKRERARGAKRGLPAWPEESGEGGAWTRNRRPRVADP